MAKRKIDRWQSCVENATQALQVSLKYDMPDSVRDTITECGALLTDVLEDPRSDHPSGRAS